MEAKILPSSLIPKASTFLPRNPSPSLRTLAALHSRHCRTLRATENENNTTESNVEADTTSSRAAPITLNIRRLSRRQARQLEVEQNVSRAPPPPPRKDWESMTLGEKAVELYVGEKGLLFWLNKFAYASIFMVIGGWILFRFVGPSLGLYQLDAPPLPPSSLLKGQS
ncbi:hypothetical protein J5N97_023889 [Dioscorea zingiberensis]|uniref:Uncharacterized protein n=1 Tax=Dioscorea zingiberensis TaxID=325984 RepID=A0A9D5C6L5_9LILI|nr:hypothetical protein J5N97_023889 [Dioscorea zingiberensis]